MPEKKCEICGKDFFTKSIAKVCSDECKKKHRSIANKKYHEKNKEKVNQRAKERYKENPDWFRERDKKRNEEKRRQRELQGEKMRRSPARLSNLSKEEREVKIQELKEERNRQKRQKYKEDKLYSMKNRIRSLINKKIRDKDFAKSFTTEKYLGCDVKTFMEYLERNFKQGMSWENRDKWHIDHIVPISRANTEEEFVLLSHYTNLQPMWAEKNISKSNKLGFRNVTGKMIKKFGERGEYQQYRYEKAVEFDCFFCQKTKKAKLVVVFDEDWSKIICNGCYGEKLSILNG